MVTVIKKVDWDGSHQIGFVNDWKCSDERRICYFLKGLNGSGWMGALRPDPALSHTGHRLARQRGGASSGVEWAALAWTRSKQDLINFHASSGVESGQNPHQFWPGCDPNKTG